MWLVGAGASTHAQQPWPADASIINKTGAQVPLDLEFLDEAGKTVRLGDYFNRGRPVLLCMVYYRCPSVCNQTLNTMTEAFKELKLAAGRDFEVVTVSFDPREGPELAAPKKTAYIEELRRPEYAAAWHFLSSHDPAAGRTLGEAIGFGYKLDAKGERYLHQAGIHLCTPDGRVAQVIADFNYDAQVLHDSLLFASEGKTSRGWFRAAAERCGLFQFDSHTGRYTWAAVALMRVVGLGTVAVVAAVLGTLMYREHRRGRKRISPSPSGRGPG